MISIIVPCYNAEDTLEKTIVSILRQTYSNFEAIFINDGSTDGTIEILRNYKKKDNRLKVIDLPLNIGVVEARNKGLSQAVGTTLAFCDSDDYWHPDKLEKQVIKILQGSHLVITDYKKLSKNRTENISARGPFTKSRLLQTNFIPMSTVLFRRSLLRDGIKFENVYLRFYDQVYKLIHEDYLLWLKIFEVNKDIKVAHIKQSLAVYTVRSTSLSSSTLKCIVSQAVIYRQYLKLSFVQTFILLMFYGGNAIKKRL